MFEFMQDTLTEFEKKRKVQTEKFGEGNTLEPKLGFEGGKSGKNRKTLEWKELITPIELLVDGDRKLKFSISQDAEETKEPKLNIRILYLAKDGEYRHTQQGFTKIGRAHV